MSAEVELRRALATAPAPVRLWWRDDDAGRETTQLRRLLGLAEHRHLPLALAVVPAWLEPPCAECILACPMATVLQHGVAHVNHAVVPAKKIELGGVAATDGIMQDLASGKQRLAGAFAARSLPALVPPWNRIAPSVTAMLPGLGFSGLSLFGPNARVPAPEGLAIVNTHLDLVAWREGGRSLTLEEAAGRLARLIDTLAEPIGILSHHLVMDDAAFVMLDRLLGIVQDQGGASFASAASLFGEEQ